MAISWRGIWIQDARSDIYFHDAPPAPYFRTLVAVPQSFQRAIVRLCGLGFHELRINGIKADDRWYAPALTQYDFRDGVIEYDVSALLVPGKKNVLTVELGNGFYNCRNHWLYTVNFYSWRARARLICDIEIDGEVVESSGVHWKMHPGPIVFDCHHEGEEYDARLELPASVFRADDDVSDWTPAARSLPPGGILEIEEGAPSRILRRLPAEEIRRESALRLFDCKENMSGVIEMKCRAGRGDKFSFRYGEILDENGRVTTANVDQGLDRYDTDSYICKGDGVERWSPKFVWHGFRYVEVTCSNPNAEILELTGLFIGTDLAVRGHVETSSDILNKVNEITLNSYRGNFMGIPTDCPTREKFGWTGDADMAMETGWWHFYPQVGLERLEKMIMDIQRPDGNFSTHGPTSLWGFEQTCPGFSAFLYNFCRYRLDFDGDDSAIKAYYDRLKLGVAFFENVIRDDALFHMGYGDWHHPDYGPDNRANGFLDTTAVESLALMDIFKTMVLFAEHLGKADDAAYFSGLTARTQAALRRTFFEPEKALFENGGWSSTAMALYFGLFTEAERPAVAAKLVKSVREKSHQAHVGILGAKYLPRALSENGYAADAYTLFTQPVFPGWGNVVASGSTTLWESWNGKTSHNHIMFGIPPAWCFRYAAGLSPLKPGFKHIGIAPKTVPQLDHVSAEYETPFGMIHAKWQRENGEIHFSYEIPTGTTAEFEFEGIRRHLIGKADFTLPDTGK